MAVNQRLITDCMLRFRNVDQRSYEEFVNLMQMYCHELTVAVTEAAPDQILVSQGRAQQMIKMVRLVTELRDPNKPTP